MTTTYIYALKDPRDHSVRYVGKSNHPHVRHYTHTHRLNTPCSSHGKRQWVTELRDSGAEPDLVILEEVPVAKWREFEEKWIRFYLERGEPLLNIPTTRMIRELNIAQPVKRFEMLPRRPWGHPRGRPGRLEETDRAKG
jgi:hypothetical protein